MGITIAGWQQDVMDRLVERGFAAAFNCSDSLLLVSFKGFPQLILHLIPIDHHLKPEILQHIQDQYRNEHIQLVQLWEDVWLTQAAKVISRICSILGNNKTIHGRKTKPVAITQQQAYEFLLLHHLQSSAKARFRYGLLYEDEIVAVATFSGKRNMTRKREGYVSVELIRFATAEGVTIQGGLSKLIRHLIKMVHPDDVMTYADLDWSYGQGFAKMGFELVSQSPPAEIWLHKKTLVRYFPHRLPIEINSLVNSLNEKDAARVLENHQFKKIYNSGNLKYVLTV